MMNSTLRVETLFAWSAHQCPVFHGFILKDNAHPSDVKLGWVIRQLSTGPTSNDMPPS